MTLSETLRTDIERFAIEMERDNALYLGAMEGRITPAIMARYLHNVRHLVANTPYFLERARDRANAAGNEDLAAFFTEKWAEEQGHDGWAHADLKRLERRFGEQCALEHVEPSLLALLRFLEEEIDRDPALYVAYILFAEYHVVLMGPKWIDALREHCDIPPNMITIIGNHAELDKEHTAEGFDAVDRLITDPAKLEPMRRSMRRCMDLFQQYCAEIVAGGAEPTESIEWMASSPA